MRRCPKCKSKLGIGEIIKSLFCKNNCVKCSNCNTELTIRIRAIINGISVVLGILIGRYLYRLFNYTVGSLFSFILALTLAVIVEIILMIVMISIIGLKKYNNNLKD